MIDGEGGDLFHIVLRWEILDMIRAEALITKKKIGERAEGIITRARVITEQAGAKGGSGGGRRYGRGPRSRNRGTGRGGCRRRGCR